MAMRKLKSRSEPVTAYDSTERYLLNFAKIVYPVENGMPLLAIRQVAGLFRRLVQKYYELYKKYSSKDFAFTMGKIRQFALANPPKKPKKEGDRKMMEGIRRTKTSSLPLLPGN